MAFLHSNGATLHYQVHGEGVPVIALHASASTGGQWRSLVGYIEGRFQVFTPDLPATAGRSGCRARRRRWRATRRRSPA